MVDVLRHDPGSLGLCTANGGLLTKHALGVYSTRPPRFGFRVARPEVPGGASVRPVVDRQPPGEAGETGATGATGETGGAGEAVIEAYTVMHDQSGAPEVAIVTALLPSGARTWRTSRRPDIMAAMMQDEFCGRAIALVADGEFRAL
jgi:acetyl-CoA C-acetyltransferase